MNVRIQVDQASLDKTVTRLEEYSRDLKEKARIICERLASLGATHASLGFARSIYNGSADFDITVEPTGNGYQILASGEAVLFLEFGAGVTMGYGHPQAGEFGYGPGTYPGAGHWDDPNGWWLPKSKGGGHSYGNPPNMGMYNASKEIQKEVERVAREVLMS